MSDEVKYRVLLERAQDSAEHVKNFLVAISDAPAGAGDDIKSLAVKTRQHLQDVQDGLDRLWDSFKRR